MFCCEGHGHCASAVSIIVTGKVCVLCCVRGTDNIHEVTAALLAVAAAAESSPGNTACRGETSPLHHAPQFSHSPSAMSRASYCGCKFEHVPAALLPCDPNMYWQLTEEEDRLISQLTEAHRVTLSSKSYVDLSKAILWEDKQVIAVVGQMSTDMMAFFSKVPDFCRMPPKDQAAAFSYSAMPLFLLRTSFLAGLYTEERGGAEEGPPVIQHEQLAHRLCHFQRSLLPILRNDLSTAVILQCAVVFDARAPELFDRQVINGLQDKYMILMKHYVESQCSYLFCWHYVEAMLALVEECKILAAMVTQQFPGWNAIIDPLIRKLKNK